MYQPILNFLQNCHPWLIPTICSGLVNAVVAYKKLNQDAKSPFFQPFKIFGFYIWLFIQIAVPSVFFWFYSKAATKPEVNPEFYLTAITVGFFFTLLVNSNSDIGFVSFSIDKYYGLLNQLAYQSISKSQTGKITRFRRDLKDHLRNNPQTIQIALDDLKEYIEVDISLNFDEKRRSRYRQQIEAAKQLSDREEQIAQIILIAHQVFPSSYYPQWLETLKAPSALIDQLKK
jgi:tryptophan-rich sensory protein